MSFLAYHGAVWSRAWRDTVTFVKAHVLGGLVIAVVTAIVTGLASADIGEAFNVRVAIYAAVAAAGIVAFWVLWWNLMTAPWRLYEEQAARLRAFERRPGVGPLVALRERGVYLLNRDVDGEVEPLKPDQALTAEVLAALEASAHKALRGYQAMLREWEDETVAELEKCATMSDISWFRVLGEFRARVFPDASTDVNHEKAMLSERLERLVAIIRRIEGGAA